MNKKLRQLIDRAEREAVNDAMKDLRAECKGQQYDATQIMRLAQLSHDDKKRAKLAESNEILNLYNRESGLGLVLGLDEITETDRAATSSAPEGPADLGKPPRPEPIPKSEAPSGATAASAGSDTVTAPQAASDTPSTTGSTLPPAGNDAHRSSSAAPSPVVETPTDDGIRPGSQEVAEPTRANLAQVAGDAALDELVELGQAMGGYDPPGYVPPPDVAAERHSVLTRHVSTGPDLARMTEAELVERAAAAKPAQPWRAA